MRVLQKLLKEIEDLKLGLDPTVLAGWYTKIASDAKAKAPLHLRESIQVVQNEILPMKFEFKTSKRAVSYVFEAIEDNLSSMPFATKLYFQKLEELIELQMSRS
jgi:hypothetical protein